MARKKRKGKQNLHNPQQEDDMSDEDKTKRDQDEYDPMFNIDRKPNGQFNGSGNPAGKKKGTLNIASRASVKKLEEMGFDPIEKLLEQYAEADTNNDGELMFKITNRLIDFGYSKQPTMSETKVQEVSTFTIQTSKKGDKDEESSS